MTQPSPPPPHLIRLETENYLVRTLELADANESWGRWLTDPETLRNLNAQPRQMSVEDLENYIRRFDRKTSHVLGTFEKASSRMIGMRTFYIDWLRREFISNILVGERESRHKGVFNETHVPVYGYFFNTLDLLTARASVVSTNEVMLARLRRSGWIQVNASRKPAADGVGFVEILSLRLPREVWKKKHEELGV